MALKVVPAGDERCDIHNRRPSPAYICEDCLKELGGEAAPVRVHRPPRRVRVRRRFRRWRSDRRVLYGVGVIVTVGVALLLATVLLDYTLNLYSMPRVVIALAAIGGITRGNAASVIEAGADSVAVISDLLRGPRKSAEEFWRT